MLCITKLLLYFIVLFYFIRLGQLITLAGIDQSQMTIPLSSPQRQSLGGRLSSSFIKPHKLDMTSSEAVLSPESLFKPIHHTNVSLHQQAYMAPAGLFDQTKNTTINTTGMSSEADVSLPRPNTIYPHIKPDNFMANTDPTLPTTPLISSRKPKSKFDELYQKVLRETEGSLTKNTVGTADVQSPMDFSRFNGNNEATELSKLSDQSRNAERDGSRHLDSGVRSDLSHHSHSSKASGKAGTTRDDNKDVSERNPDSGEEDDLELDPGNMILEGHSHSDSNKSDISNIVEDIEDNTGNKDDDSSEENF